jgi:4-hydroxythreonine-4-phosphate dehydrogenase
VAKPVIAITAGDPSGIGPEISVKAAADARVLAVCEPVIYGAHTAEELTRFPVGQMNAEAGLAAFEAIGRAVRDALDGRVAAVVTAPVSKAAFAAAGLPWRGHTDLLAHLCGAHEAVMFFWSDRLKVALATVHIPLAEVPAALTSDRLRYVLRTVAAELPHFGLASPRVAVAGLNPHAGEGGLLGSEDQDVIAPVVEQLRRGGLDVTGPLPADTVFARAVRGEFDVVVAAYHDQGLIPVKLASFGRAVNVTLGLPIIRTSVDHGTAFDIARTGTADPGSLVEAILLAATLADRRTGRRAG